MSASAVPMAASCTLPCASNMTFGIKAAIGRRSFKFTSSKASIAFVLGGFTSFTLSCFFALLLFTDFVNGVAESEMGVTGLIE